MASKRRYPERDRARNLLFRAVARGVIVKKPCHCGEVKVEAHHPDYNKPLEVEWYCNPHHREADRQQREAATHQHPQ